MSKPYSKVCTNEKCKFKPYVSMLDCIEFYFLCLLWVWIGFRWTFSNSFLWGCLLFILFVSFPNIKKKMLIFLDTWGNSPIPDKLPQKSAKWLSPPQRHGCKNWKGFHFWLFHRLQKEIFASVRSLKTVARNSKLPNILLWEHCMLSFFPLLLPQMIWFRHFLQLFGSLLLKKTHFILAVSN